MTTQQQQDPQPIKTIRIEATEFGEDPYDLIFFDDGSFQFVPMGDEIFHTHLFFSPRQVSSFITEFGEWIITKMTPSMLGEKVRRTWVAIKEKELGLGYQVPPDHLKPYQELDKRNQQIDDRIGMEVVEFFLFFAAFFLRSEKQPLEEKGQIEQALKRLGTLDTIIKEDSNKRKRDRLEHDQFLLLVREKEELMDQVKRATGRRPFWTEKGYSIYDDED